MSANSGPRFTPQQAAAIETRNVSIALSAGAGCGKTFVLTQRFLAELEPGPQTPELSSLAAITFTDRAAREMRDRVRAACRSRLQNCDLNHVGHWLRTLRGLDGARISTIHAFCSGILRTFAVEAKLDPRFALLDESLGGKLLAETVRGFVHRRLETGCEETSELVLHYGLETLGDILASFLNQRFRAKPVEWRAMSSRDVLQLWNEAWHQDFVPRLFSQFLEEYVVINLVDLLQRVEPSNAKMIQRRESLLSGLKHFAENPSLELLEALRELAKVQGIKASDFDSAEIYEQLKESFEAFRKGVDKLKLRLDVSPDAFENAVGSSHRVRQILPDLLSAYDRSKLAESSLDFDDLLLRTRDLLRDYSSVRERISRGIHLLMVDEFQDTDPVQAEIVRSLCGDRLTTGKLFLVGDHKQSIYRFRRADPQVFANLRNEIPAAGRLPLSVNFRSQPEILRFVNRLFGPAMGANYEPLSPFDSRQMSPTPAIEFLWANFDAMPQPTVDHAPNAQDLRRREADWIARRIGTLLEDETPRVRTKDSEGNTVLRRVTPEDIVVLFRSLVEVQEYEAALRRYDLEYYLVGGRAFYAQQEVFDLVNLCQWLQDPDDGIPLVGVLRSPMFNLSDDTIHAWITQGGGIEALPLAEIPENLPVDQHDRAVFAQQVLVELAELKGRISLVDLLQTAISRTAYDASLLNEFLGNRKVANLRKLLEEARRASHEGQLSFAEFASRLRESIQEEVKAELAATLPETSNVIRLMTIHQSKGLEFPVVFIADAGRKSQTRGVLPALHGDWGPLLPVPRRPEFEDDVEADQRNPAGIMMLEEETRAEQDESIRLFYVATTRAADHLVISAAFEDHSQAFRSPWLNLLGKQFGLETGLPVGDSLLGASKSGTAGREAIPEILVHRAPPQPQEHRIKGEGRKGVPLTKLQSQIAQAEPVPLPAVSNIYQPSQNFPPTVSVSTLENLAYERGWLPRGHRENSSDQEEFLSSSASRIRFGDLIHGVLQQSVQRGGESWEALLEQQAEIIGQRDGEDFLEEARAVLGRWSRSPLAAQMKKARQLRTEMEFLVPWPSSHDCQVLISGTMDTLFQTEDGAWQVWDYKTGLVGQRVETSLLVAPYTLQLFMYAFAMEQWLGEWPTQAGLVYLRPQFLAVAPDWSEEFRADSKRLVDSLVAEILGSKARFGE